MAEARHGQEMLNGSLVGHRLSQEAKLRAELKRVPRTIEQAQLRPESLDAALRFRSAQRPAESLGLERFLGNPPEHRCLLLRHWIFPGRINGDVA